MLGQQDLSNRQSEIADLVQSHGFMSVESLAERFDVTTQTIRRDVNRLCELGILRRTHGGVEPPVPGGNVHYSTRRIMNLPQKRRIARMVASMIPDGASSPFPSAPRRNSSCRNLCVTKACASLPTISTSP
ncbi:DeoR/GlpR family DNA-binding transcription regulator [Pannonibacter sp. Pt2-lr]